MSHFLINPTWRCQNNCSYCWMNKTVKRRDDLYKAADRPMTDWQAAISKAKPDLVDIAGGEPLLLDWIPDLIASCPDVRFGLSTNGIEFAQVQRLAEMKLPNIVAINISYHPESKSHIPDYDIIWYRSVVALNNAGYLVQSNIVDYGNNVTESSAQINLMNGTGALFCISPYEEVKDLGHKRETGLLCEGGINHIVAAPDGMTWPCLTSLRSPYYRDYVIGNWLDGELDISRKEQPCYLDCADYYILKDNHEAGDMWQVKARPA